MFRQLCEALQYLHERGVVHRDIKLENILLDHNGDLKLADFGFARFIHRLARSESFCGTRWGSFLSFLDGMILFRPYSAPELIKREPYSPYAVDWYAAGVVLYTMLVGKWPHVSLSPHSL